MKLRNTDSMSTLAGMDRLWKLLEKSTMRIGGASATGIGVLCLTVVLLVALLR